MAKLTIDGTGQSDGITLFSLTDIVKELNTVSTVNFIFLKFLYLHPRNVSVLQDCIKGQQIAKVQLPPC